MSKRAGSAESNLPLPLTSLVGRSRELAEIGGRASSPIGMRLLCVPHHGKLSRGWRLERGPAGRWVVHPPRLAAPVFGPAIHDPPSGHDSGSSGL